MVIDWFPLWLSLRVAFISTALALAGGLWLAYVLANRDFRGKDVVDAAVTLPLVLPPTVLGYYLLVLLGRASPFGKLWESTGRRWCSPERVVAALPHAALAGEVGARSLKRDCSFERAARAWAPRMEPVLRAVAAGARSILAAAALAFARSLGDFGVTSWWRATSWRTQTWRWPFTTP
jgi:molybdate transport system permease protein